MVAVLVIGAVLLARVAAAAPAAPGDSGRCLTCHAMANLATREGPSAPLHVFSVSAQQFSASVHGRLTCQQCHGEVGPYPHPFPSGREKVTCAQDCHATSVGGGRYTHAATVADFEASAHRTGAAGDPRDRPTCLTCHGAGNPHAIAPARHQSPRARMNMCAGCHDDRARMLKNHVEADAVASYRRSFHYKAITFGSLNAAACPDCHTAHRILGAADARSSVSPAMLTATCGQTACHSGARASFAVSGANHLDLRIKREPVLAAEEWLFWSLTTGTMAMLGIGIVLDIQKTFGWAALVKRIGVRLGRRLEAIAVGCRRSVKFVRWLLVE